MLMKALFALLCVGTFCAAETKDTKTVDINQRYQYDVLTSLLQDFAAKYPNKAYLYSIGKSVEQKDLWVLAISESSPNVHLPLRPEAKFVGAMHANEMPSKELLIEMIDLLLVNPHNDPNINTILKTTRVHILPAMNPDGLARAIYGDCASKSGRNNSNNYDLNRNFPDYFECNPEPLQPEIQAFINWMDRNQFVLSANFHSGEIVVDYPYDNGRNKTPGSTYSATGDDDVFRYLASTYADNHPSMRQSPCGNEKFNNGIINGAEWYPSLGSIQDFSYWRYGYADTSIEIGCCLFPNETETSRLWDQNRQSMIEYLKLANIGIKGVVKFKNGQPVAFASVKIDSRDPVFKTNEDGEYYRILLPGTYNLTLLYACDMVIYSTQVTLTKEAPLIELTITLPDYYFDVYHQQYHAKLDRYALFCEKDQGPIACKSSSNKDKPSSSTTFVPNLNMKILAGLLLYWIF